MTFFNDLYTRALGRPVVHKGELLSVQRLRGIAVLMVLIVHIEDAARHFPGWGTGLHSVYTRHLGYSAADLFFVISGFIMAYITFTRPFNARSWAISRVIRIYPMYMLFTLFVVALWLRDPRMTMGTGTQDWGRVIASLVGLPQADLPLLYVGWTVEHEIVFYLVVFLTARFLGRERLFLVMGILSALAGARWLLHLAGVEIWDFHLTSLYMIQFTMGVLLFRWWDRLAVLGWRLPMAVGAVFLVIAFVFAESGTINHEPMVRVLGFGCAYSCLLLSVLNLERAQRAAGREWLHRDPLVWIGDASYSLYLTHPFVLGAFGKLFPLFGESVIERSAMLLVAAVTALAAGLITHVLLERQVMELGRRLSRPRAAPLSKGVTT